MRRVLRGDSGWFDGRTVDAVLAVMRDAQQARDAGACSREAFLRGTRRVVGADMVALATMDKAALHEGMFSSTVVGARADACEAMASFYRGCRPERDPFSSAMLHAVCAGEITTRRRRDVVTDRVWYDSPVATELHKSLGADDVVLSMRPTGPGIVRGLVLKRGTDARPFTPGQVQLVELLHRGFTWLDDDAEHAASAAPRGLSPREKQVFASLLCGEREKLIADALGVSTHTVHDYVKAVYRKLGVSSRPELMSRYGALARGRKHGASPQ